MSQPRRRRVRPFVAIFLSVNLGSRTCPLWLQKRLVKGRKAVCMSDFWWGGHLVAYSDKGRHLPSEPIMG